MRTETRPAQGHPLTGAHGANQEAEGSRGLQITRWESSTESAALFRVQTFYGGSASCVAEAAGKSSVSSSSVSVSVVCTSNGLDCAVNVKRISPSGSRRPRSDSGLAG